MREPIHQSPTTNLQSPHKVSSWLLAVSSKLEVTANRLLPTKNKVFKMKYELSIIGLGYVGLPLALQFAKSGCRVLGLDIDPGKVKEIEAGRSYEASSPSRFLRS